MSNRMMLGRWRLVAAALLCALAIAVVAARMALVPAPASAANEPAANETTVRVTPPANAASAFQVLLPWSAVAATGAVDEDSLADYAFNDPWATYRPNSLSLDPLTFRYNVTHPGWEPPIPGWTQLFLSSWIRAAGSAVRATLIRVDPCTGERTELCTAVNNQVTDIPICTRCEFAANDINFQQYLYYVRVQMNRSDQPDPPRAYSVHLRP